jgi:hypothetical protein
MSLPIVEAPLLTHLIKVGKVIPKTVHGTKRIRNRVAKGVN